MAFGINFDFKYTKLILSLFRLVASFFIGFYLFKILNSKITSQHCANNGAAADFEIFGYDNKEVASHIKNNFEFDQLILEYYDSSDINSGWIHCSFKSGANRKESLTKDKAGYQKWE